MKYFLMGAFATGFLVYGFKVTGGHRSNHVGSELVILKP